MTPKFGKSNGELRCPNCDGDYLHHTKVESFERREDADTGIHTVIESHGTSVDANLAGNPSGRRNGVLIHFECEFCDALSVLSLNQHKGMTFVEFNYRIKD